MDRLDVSLRTDPSAASDTARALWSEFAEAASAESFCRSWLALQCRMISGVSGGLLLPTRCGDESAGRARCAADDAGAPPRSDQGRARAELEVEAELVDYATGRMLFGLVTTFPADTEAGRVLILP